MLENPVNTPNIEQRLDSHTATLKFKYVYWTYFGSQSAKHAHAERPSRDLSSTKLLVMPAAFV